MNRTERLLALGITLILLTACSLAPARSGSTVSASGRSTPSASSAPSVPAGAAQLWDVEAYLSEQGAVFLDMWEDSGRTLVLYLLDREDSYLSLALLDPDAMELVPLINYIHPDSRIGMLDQSRVAILEPGSDLVSSNISWPIVRRLALSDHPLVVSVTESPYAEPYYMPLDQSFALGEHRDARVEGVTLTRNQIYFEFGDNGGLFAGGGPNTPEMQVSFLNEICTVFFPGSLLDAAFAVLPSDGTPDAITLLSAEDTLEGALLTFSCPSLPERAGLTRWYIEEHTHPVTDLPGASIHLVRDWGSTYPQGW